jgi:hypothetical protein
MTHAAPHPNTAPQVFQAWTGGLAGRRPWRARLSLVAPLRVSTAGGSGSFLGRGSDARDYWIKVLNNGQGTQVPVTEQLVGRAGALIGAPSCAVAIIFISSAVAGWPFRPGKTLERGFAHASLAVDLAVEAGALAARTADNNTVRHAGYFALYDWCWGGDPQGLLSLSENQAFYSHDHGWFLPPNGPGWNMAQLIGTVDLPNEYGGDTTGIDLGEVSRLATALEAVSRSDLTQICAAIPRSWPVTDADLEHVGAYLEWRAPLVANRLRARFGVAP